MKLLVLGGILYLYYHFYFRKSALNAAEEDIKIESSDADNDDYVDYEEVE